MKFIVAIVPAGWLAAAALAAAEPTTISQSPHPERVESASALVTPVPTRMDLRTNWFLQSSSKISAPAEASRLSPDHWYKITVPSTLLVAQVATGEFKDIYFGDNLRKLPGMAQAPDALNGNPYLESWWYRTEFKLPDDFRGRKVWLHFNGINTKANVWLNGKKLANSTDVAGAFRIFELDATPMVEQVRPNVLAVEVFSPTNSDFGINLVDWVPKPPDKNMGLWCEVYLTASGPARLRYPTVVTHFPDDSLQRVAHYNSFTAADRLRLEVSGWNIDAQTAPIEE